MRPSAPRIVGTGLAGLLLALLLLPLIGLGLAVTPHGLATGFADPAFADALWLSVQTTLVSLATVVILGTPLAWWLATETSRAARTVGWLVDLPIVMPPAVLGVALLQTFGRQGWLGPALGTVGLTLPFTTTAVVVAQVVVAAPFYVQAAANAFRQVDPELLLVARTLGASPWEAWTRVALPIARPGLIAGASLAWARALGEFGATLLFAGNRPGHTQTLPLAIFSALEANVQLAVVFSVVLAALGGVLLFGVRAAPRWLSSVAS